MLEQALEAFPILAYKTESEEEGRALESDSMN